MFRAGAARGGSGSESCRFAAGGAGGRDSRLYYANIKIETPEASASGVFNLCIVFSAHLGWRGAKNSKLIPYRFPGLSGQAYPRTNGSPARSAINRATLFGR
jgi:hypothetical protein